MFSKSMAMDLGTANTLIYVKGEGIVLNEPSVVAYHRKNEQVLAVGKEAKKYLGRTPVNIDAIRPLKDGVIADFIITKTMIREFFKKVQHINRLFKPRVIICVPAGITQVEKRAVCDAAEEAGAGKIHLIEEPMAAAIGADLDVHAEKGQMVIDIGGGTTEVAVISKASVVCSESIRLAGDEFNEAIIHYLHKHHQLQIGENSAEELKIKGGSATDVHTLQESYTVSGKYLPDNKPKEISIDKKELQEAIKGPVNAIVEVVIDTLEKTPAKLLQDIKKEGIYMAGGGAMLHGLDSHIEAKTGIKCRQTADPLTTVVMGGGKVMDQIKKYRKVFIN